MAELSAMPMLERRGAWVLLILGLLLLLPGNHVLPLLDRDEPRFARATVEMMDRNEWVVPYFNADPAQTDADRIAAMRAGRRAMDVGFRFDKPVLTYWLMRAGYTLFGVNEFGARFHSVATAIGLVLVVRAMGRRWFSARIGLLAGFGLLTCLQMMIHGRSAVADMPMVLCVTLAMWAGWELVGRYAEKPDAPAAHPGWWWLFYSALGVGFLAKGPVAWLVPLFAGLLWRFAFWRQPLPWRRLRPLAGVPLLLLIVGAWGIPALLQTEGLFWKIGMGEHVIERGAKAFNGRFPFPLYYCLTAFVSLFPWSAYAGTVWQVARTQRNAQTAFLVAWFLAPILIFSFYATQLMHYILPGFAAFFLLLAQGLDQPVQRPWIRTFRQGFSLVFSLLPVVAVVAFRLFDWPPSPALTFCLFGVFVLIYGLNLTSQAVTLRGGSILRSLGLGAIAISALVIGFGLRQLTPSIPLAGIGVPGTPSAFYRYREPSLVFYSGRPWQPLTTIEEARAFLAGPSPRVLVVEDGEAPILGRGGPSDFSAEVASLPTNDCHMAVVQGLNVARGKRVTVRAIWKGD